MHKQIYKDIICEICKSENISFESYADDWTIKLSKDNRIYYIVGYTLPLNDAACHKIIRNKNVCSDILSASGIKNVPHQLLLGPSILKRRGNPEGILTIVEEFINKYGYPIVLKRNNSSKGDGVYFISNNTELEEILIKLFSIDNILCLSPYRSVLNEYRTVILDGECMLTYNKIKPHLIGNGKSTFVELLYQHYELNRNINPTVYTKHSIDLLHKYNLNDIIPLGKIVELQWKHNSVPGVEYEIIVDNDIRELGINAAKVVNARFVTVDIIKSSAYGNEVIEVNASVLLNTFALKSTSNYLIALDIYREALLRIF